jgi:hypothetical protein
MSLPEPYYDDPKAGITIYHGDCREILPLLGRFDLLLSDPPWGVNIDTANHSRKRGVRAVGHDHPPCAGDNEPFDPVPALSVSERAILWGANNFADRLEPSPMWLVWDRVTGEKDMTDAELAWVRGHRFRTVRTFRHQWAGVLRASENAMRVLHPMQKPVALMSWCLSFFPEAKTVVDPYMGSGPVAKACKDRGLRYVGIELVEKYCEIAVNRLRQEVLFGG